VTSPPVIQVADLPSDDELRNALDEAVDVCGSRLMNADENAAWQIVHGLLAYGPQLQIIAGGQTVPALDYLLKGGNLRGWLLRPGDKGVEVITEAGSKSGQGHEDQWLGYLSQVGLTLDTPIVVSGKTYTINDLVTQAQWDIFEGMEATWTLMAISTLLPLDAKWTARDGQEWTTERVLGMECKQNLNTSACGGTHRLYAITIAVNRYLGEGKELTGAWKEADTLVQDCMNKVKNFQQPDGALSANYFDRASDTADIENRMRTTGHTLEVLTVGLSDQQIREPWVRLAAWRLCDMFEQTRELPVECGALYHAARGLMLYRYRIFGPRDMAPSSEPATTPAESTAAVEPETQPQ